MEQERKYELTEETKAFDGHTLHRIRAIRGFGDVKAGDLGGWIEKEANLSHEGAAWVYDNVQVYGNARVFGNARVYDNAQVSDNVQVFGNARAFGNARVYDNAQVYGDARVYGNAWVYGNACISGKARVYGNAHVFSYAWVYGNARVYDNARVFGYAWVRGDAWVHGDAQIEKKTNYLIVGQIGSRNDTTTFFRDRNLGIAVACGCFLGTLDAFEQKVNEVHGNDRHGKVYAAAIALARVAMEGEEE